MRWLQVGLQSGLALCLLTAAAVAQQPTQAQTNAIRQSCRSDYESFCASVPTGGRAALQCLQQHLDSLSSPCQSAVAAVSGPSGAPPPATRPAQSYPPAGRPPPLSPRQEVAMLRGACGQDYRAYCRGVPLGGGRALACLAENGPSLSRPCREALAEAQASRGH